MTAEEFLASLSRDTTWAKIRRAVLYNPRRAVKLARRAPVRWWQRARYGYSEQDTWSISHYAADVLAKMVADLRERMLGYPADIDVERWDEMLSKIERGFMAALAVMDGGADDDERYLAEFREGMALFSERFFDLWD